jgi:ribonuclease D
MRRVTRIAVDTEADSMHHYYAKVCLIQLAMEGEHWIVDPLAGLDLGEFMEVLAQKQLILHGGDYDLRMLRSSFGFRPQQGVFDTGLAAQLLGYSKFGLISLVEAQFQVTLTDLGKKTNWSKRPLTSSQLEYACNDTRYLEAMTDIFTEKLTALGRLEWHRELCQRMVDGTLEEKAKDEDDAWRIKGKSQLDRRQLAFLREIWHWREAEAQLADLPPFKVLMNQKLIELALWASAHPTTPVSQGPKLPVTCRGKRLHALEKAIHAAAKMSPKDWPFHKKPTPAPKSEPFLKQRIEKLAQACTVVAEGLGIAVPVLASRAILKAIANHKPQTKEGMIETSGMQRWQADLLWPALQPLLHDEQT